MREGGGALGRFARKLPRRLGQVVGPGLITGAADDDPAGITTYSQAGASFQYGLLWTALLQIPLMIAVQFTCARIGLVTGRDLGAVLREHYARWVLWSVVVVLVVANTFTAAADIAGIAAGVELLTHIHARVVISIIALAIIGFLVFGSYAKLEKTFKWLTVALFGYLLSGILAGPAWGEVLKRTVVPGLRHSFDYLSLFVSVFGTTISPYLFVWQSGEEVDDVRGEGARSVAERRRIGVRKIREARLDTISGMIVSQLIGYFIIVAAGATLYPSGHRTIGTAREAALALKPIGGGLGTFIFALGMIGTGLLAVPTLTGASAFVIAGLARRPAGMSQDWRRAKTFYGVIAVSTLIAAAAALTGISPVALLLTSALLNGVLAPPMLVVILLIANDDEIMRGHRNGWLANVLVGASLVIMAASSIWLGAWWLQTRR